MSHHNPSRMPDDNPIWVNMDTKSEHSDFRLRIEIKEGQELKPGVYVAWMKKRDSKEGDRWSDVLKVDTWAMERREAIEKHNQGLPDRPASPGPALDPRNIPF